MDLSREVKYRGFRLNYVEWDALTHDLRGCTLSTVEYGQVIGAGYDEKRAMDEGRDASDVYLDQRFISMSGTIYGRSRAEAFDLFGQFSEVMSPSAAYRDDPSHRGYSPLYFWRPTDNDAFSTHLIQQMLQARPLATPSARFQRSVHGNQPDEAGNPRDGDALAIPWTAQLAAKDPRILNAEATKGDLSGHHVTVGVKPVGSGTIRNRGTVPAVVEVYLVIPPRINGDAPGKLALHIDDTWGIELTLPSSDSECILRYSTDQKVVGWGPSGGTLALRMDLITRTSGSLHKHLSASTAPKGYDWTLTRTGSKTLRANSVFNFRDTWV